VHGAGTSNLVTSSPSHVLGTTDVDVSMLDLSEKTSLQDGLDISIKHISKTLAMT